MTSSWVQATILLIGGHADVRATRAEGLRQQGYQVLTAAHVPEAEAIGQCLGLESLDLVILDLSWTNDPQVREEYALVQRWGAQAPHLPFILIGDDRLSGRLDPVWSKYLNSPSHWRLRFYHLRCFGLSSAPLSPILSVNKDGKGWGEAMDWKQLLAYITGTVDQELLLRNEYLVTENRILRSQITGRVRLTDGERKTLATIGQKLGKQALEDVASLVKPDTILAWHRKLVAQKFDGSTQRKAAGRPMIDQEVETLAVRMARENRSWGYDRIVGALANLGYTISAQTVGNILKRHGIPSVPERKTTTTWNEFIRTHMEVLVATDFFTAEVWTLGGLVTYYVLFFIHLSSRKVHIAGMTPQPNQAWMMQVARNVTMEQWGFLSPGQYLIHDRDGKYCSAFQQLIDAAGVTRMPLPPRSPNLNAYAERWVRSVKEECLSRLILFGEASLRHALTQYVEHFHHERNHQGKGNVRLFPAISQGSACQGPIQCRERLGGLLKYYAREAA